MQQAETNEVTNAKILCDGHLLLLGLLGHRHEVLAGGALAGLDVLVAVVDVQGEAALHTFADPDEEVEPGGGGEHGIGDSHDPAKVHKELEVRELGAELLKEVHSGDAEVAERVGDLHGEGHGGVQAGVGDDALEEDGVEGDVAHVGTEAGENHEGHAVHVGEVAELPDKEHQGAGEDHANASSQAPVVVLRRWGRDIAG